MTGQQMCERIVRFYKPTWSDEAVRQEALHLWNASPTGELWHVLALWETLPHEAKV